MAKILREGVATFLAIYGAPVAIPIGIVGGIAARALSLDKSSKLRATCILLRQWPRTAYELFRV